MLKVTLTHDTLREIIASLPEKELKGVALLREYRPQGQFFPSAVPDIEAITEAINEIVDYTRQSRRAGEKLHDLSPIPVTNGDVLEFGL